MKINKLVCRIVLDTRRMLTDEQLKAFEWGVKAPN
jgi:hypothetical protein